jgi:hypothetical protein
MTTNIIKRIKELKAHKVEEQSITVIAKSGWCWRCGWYAYHWYCGWKFCIWMPTPEEAMTKEEMLASLTVEEKKLIKSLKEA